MDTFEFKGKLVMLARLKSCQQKIVTLFQKPCEKRIDSQSNKKNISYYMHQKATNA